MCSSHWDSAFNRNDLTTQTAYTVPGACYIRKLAKTHKICLYSTTTASCRANNAHCPKAQPRLLSRERACMCLHVPQHALTTCSPVSAGEMLDDFAAADVSLAASSPRVSRLDPLLLKIAKPSKRPIMSILQLRACKVAVVAVLLIFAALYWHVEAHAARTVTQSSFQDTDAPAVRVQFIGESLCPDCAAFTTEILDPVYRSDLKHIVDLDYIGWGNAKNTSGTPECQHGPRECKLNKALNCAQHYSRYKSAILQLISATSGKSHPRSLRAAQHWR